MNDLHKLAKSLKAKTDNGAVVMFDRELWDKVTWEITPSKIEMHSGSCALLFWTRGDSRADAMRVIAKRLRVLVDA